MAVKKNVELVEITPIVEKTAHVRLIGDSPLITHCWDAKAKREILESTTQVKAMKKKEPQEPVAEFCSSMYWLNPMPEEFSDEAVDTALKTARFGFPVTAFKQAAISAAYRMGWAKDKVSLRGAFYITPDADGYYAGDLRINDTHTRIEIIPNVFQPTPLVEIKGDAPVMRMDIVTVGMGKPCPRYRGEFRNWYVDMNIRYNINGNKSIEDIINIINAGGYYCGVGEWRPERDGQYGMYHVELIN